jgi:hypothetical protein
MVLDAYTEDQLDALSVPDLAIRMDQIIETNQLERYGRDYFVLFPEQARRALHPTVTDFLRTAIVRSCDESRQRRLAYRFFACMVQRDLTMAAGGLMNAAVYTPDYDVAVSSRSPRVRFNQAALEQYVIISSRMLAENLLELIYDLATGAPLPASVRSRLKTFKKWLLKPPPTPYVYFAQLVLSTYHFDRKHRSPEIHAGSRYPRKLLLLQPEGERFNPFDLVNENSSVWGALFAILDERLPTQFSGTATDRQWMDAYVTRDAQALERLLREMLGQMQE